MSDHQPNTMLAWLRLLRVANLPSAIANILMAYLLANQSWAPSTPLVCLILASSALYMAGMVLNDVFDTAIDLEQRPTRPIPAGEISKRSATFAGAGLICLGIGMAFIAGRFCTENGTMLPTWIAIALAICVVLYDGPLKRTLAAPFLMGGCRSLNILLGASTFAGATSPTSQSFGYSNSVWWIASCVFVLISGVTLLGRKEAVAEQSKTPLLIAGLMILASLIGWALVVYCPNPNLEISPQQQRIFPLFIALISFPILRRVGEAVLTARPKSIQAGVISVLRSLIILDAATCYLASPHQPAFAIGVLALLIPTMLLGRIIPST